MPIQVSPEAFPQWLASLPAGTRPLVLDVREPWEHALAHIAPDGCDVQLLPMGEIPNALPQLDPDRPTACLCHHGVRSMHVALFLERSGFEQVANLTGGIDAWSALDPQIPRY